MGKNKANRSHGSSNVTGRISPSTDNDDLDECPENGLELLIPWINQLQEVFNTTGIRSDVIQLPQIVVVGGCRKEFSSRKSCGEIISSPRGEGIVTRCPIVLKLIHTPDSEAVYGEFIHEPGKEYHNFKDIEKEIISKTEQLAGKNSGITKDKIQLTVYSPHVVTLTLVDLPGVVKVPVGDQPADIETQITDLIIEYIKEPTSIILAVSAANIDIANSDALKLANQVDPNKRRTIAVVTKEDLGSDCTDVLTGRLIPMKRGIIGVVNRSQNDIEKNKSIKDVAEAEAEFFKMKYPSIASQHGTPYLAKRLRTTLMEHIGDCFPSLDMRITELTSTYKAQLEELGSEVELNDSEKMEVMVEILDKFVKEYTGHINGKDRDVDTKEIPARARINFIFGVTFDKNLQLLDPLEDVTDMEIIIATAESRGVEKGHFNAEDPFQALMTKQIKKMKMIAIHCANLVHQEMVNLIPKCLDPANQRFPKVNGKISQVVNELLQSRAEVSKEMLGFYIDAQSAPAPTADLDFHVKMAELVKKINVLGLGTLPVSEILKYGGVDTILTMAGGQTMVVDGPHTLTEEQTTSCQVVKELMSTFFQLVRKEVRDNVVKSVLHFLVYFTVANVYKVLTNRLHSVDVVKEVIQESEMIADRRKMIQRDVQALNKAIDVLRKVRENILM